MSEAIYKIIKKHIMQQINTKIYKPNDKIPTESELSKKFDVSRQTVNKALRELANEDILERIAGSGTFVKNPKKHTTSTILDLKNIVDEILQRGNVYTNEIISLKTIKANEEISQILNIVKDEKIYLSEIIHKENNIPVRFDIRYIRPCVAPDYINQSFKNITPFEYLKKQNPPKKSENTIEASLVNKKIQKFLQISKNEPCLIISRLIYSENIIANYSKLYYPGSRCKLQSSFIY